MKKIFVLALAAFFSAGAYAHHVSISEKALKAFHETFTAAEEVTWHEQGDDYSVHFLQADIRYIVHYDQQGKIIGAMRFYKPAHLPMNILAEITRLYSNKKLAGVTEITAGDNVAYFVKMEDSKYWLTVKFTPYGDSEVYEKFKKQL
ncbi:MAG TPA: hypothetical protein VFV68_10560 [Agriterribacter sp.]|nr:hypothetical protein [Agriterribacter sp.]